MGVRRCFLSAWILAEFIVFLCGDSGFAQADVSKNVSHESNDRSKRHAFGASYGPSCRRLPPIMCTFSKYRTADGTCNNLRRPHWGSARTPMKRLLPFAYEKVTRTHSTPRLLGVAQRPLPSPRTVSNFVHTSRGSNRPLTTFSNAHQAFGQFFDHDINFTPMQTNPDNTPVKNCCKQFNPFKLYEERKWPCWPIPITRRDDVFKNRNCMQFVRSRPSEFCHSNTGNPLAWEQSNDVTSWIDASMVYGSSLKKQRELRTGRQGRMKVRGNDLLPAGNDGMCMERLPLTPLMGHNFYCLKAGDDRSNEHPALSTFHVIFVRLHNDICGKLALINRHWGDEKLFQEARKILGAIIQVITYKEWLPDLVGPAMTQKFQLYYSDVYFKYNPFKDPSMINEFATAAFRYGHSQVPNSFSVGNRKVELKLMFHNPSYLEQHNGRGLDLFTSGMLKDNPMAADRFLSDGLANRMFEIPGKFAGLDLAAINIQRGRDHGFPGYNDYRKLFGNPSITSGPKGLQNKHLLQYVYNHLNDVDLYTGGLMETPLPGAMVGPTFANIIGEMFHRLKFADRFWWEAPGHFSYSQRREVSQVTIAKVFCVTANLENDQTQVRGFEAPSYWNTVRKCASILGHSPHISRYCVAGIDLRKWRA
ncbi:chorion peroxidase-like [Gigantopelta aegis]|uniref:chorion peroxidase-like n=1 Tax=Gigantopelta aegis TaxID=1735272 RepID=UPI001B88A1AF|nr:chorion peroxidase-like [Gigantopelta aegis]